MKKLKFLILYIILFFSIIIDISFLPTIFNKHYFYVIKPLYWSFVFIVLLFFYKDNFIKNNKYKKITLYYVCLSILIYYLIYVWIGFINGFAYNPYSNNVKVFLLNLWTFIPMLLTREYIRTYILNNCNQKKIITIVLFTSIVFVLAESNLFKINIYFNNSISTLKYFMEIFIPNLILQLYLSYINYFSGFIMSFGHSLINQIILYSLPILPNLEAPVLAILNSTFPFLTYLIINFQINKLDKTVDRKKVTKLDKNSIVLLFLVIIFMLCFGLGVFPYEPLVIASNSMAPQIYKGDIAIIKDTNFKDLKKGEIIKYKLDNYYVVHRIEEIIVDNGEKKLITKGDNNRDIDLYSVDESQFKGTIKFKIAYLGWPTILLNNLLNNSDDVRVEKGVEISEK